MPRRVAYCTGLCWEGHDPVVVLCLGEAHQGEAVGEHCLQQLGAQVLACRENGFTDGADGKLNFRPTATIDRSILRVSVCSDGLGS